MNGGVSYFNERLRYALDSWGLGVMAFRDAVATYGVEGATYPAIRRYLAGSTTPSLAFVSVASRVLGVSAGWLAFGEYTDDTDCSGCALWQNRARRAVEVLEGRDA